jgi:hypothetical protein
MEIKDLVGCIERVLRSYWELTVGVIQLIFIEMDFDETYGSDITPALLMDQSIHRHNSMSMTGRLDNAVGNLAGGEYSVFAMNRSRQRFIEILSAWQNNKEKKAQRTIRDQEKETLVT